MIVEHPLAVIATAAADLLKHGRRQWCSTRCGDRAYARRTAMD